jgi:colanic acid/amylovoran biosynthesis glycosyltransferase
LVGKLEVKQQRRVAHFVRKLLPPFTAFIRDQIMNQVRYKPYIIYKEFIDSDFSREIINSFTTFYCEKYKKGISKKYSQFLYKNFRRLTPRDKKNIMSFLHDNKIDILHFHYGTDATMFIDIAKYSKIPSVVSFYGYDCSSFPHWYFGLAKILLLRVFKYVDYCLAMSEDMKADLMKVGCPENKIIVHYHGIDIQKFFYNRQYERKNNITLLIVAYLVPQKGHLFLLQAFKKALVLTNKRLNLRVVGDGYLMPKLERFVRQNNMSTNISFIGALEHLSPEFLKEYHNADIFVLPSVVSQAKEKEGIPGTIVEAMASGLPVISTYHAGIPYIINHGENGYLVKEWDIDNLAKYMCQLAEDEELRESLGKKAQIFALKQLNLEQNKIILEDNYDLAIKNHIKTH